jgi:hypothetical protein
VNSNFLKNRKFIMIGSLIILAGAAHQMMFTITPLREVPKLMVTLRAKEFCSCYFVLGKGKDYCLNSVKKGYPLFEYSLNEEEKTIQFNNPISSASAKFISDRLGCQINQ